MQQTNTLSDRTPTNLSPSFQDWLAQEKAAARSHQARILKTVVLICVIGTALLLSNTGSFQDVIALIAGALGLGGVATVAVDIAWVLFIIGIILFIVFLIAGRRPHG